MPVSAIPRMSPDELRAIRATLGKTQVEMAELLGTHRSAYQKWELGTTRMLGAAVLLARRLLNDHGKLIEKSTGDLEMHHGEVLY